VKAVFRVGGVSNKVAPGAIPTPHAKPVADAAAPAPAPVKVSKPKPVLKPAPKKPEPEVVKQMITIRQVRSGICTPVDQKQALKGLGLRRIRHEVVRPDSRAIRGQVLKVRHLVEIVGSTPISK
jgi:large subunit ribosomal protein L30